jgi:protoporphyrinogen oxidase
MMKNLEKQNDSLHNEPVIIIGAGPAGLAAAYELTKKKRQALVFEKADKVGGIARTETYKDYLFDIGGHRFFTKIEIINTLWKEILGKDFLKVSRISRIYYRGRFFKYPIEMFDTLRNLGFKESFLIASSYLHARLRPYPEEETFEQWVSNRFGRRLFRTFFKTYTEKVWGVPCNKIRADWAAERIKGLSLTAAVANALIGRQKSKSLISEFNYPLLGPGMMWQRFREKIEEGGGRIRLESEVVVLKQEHGRIVSVGYTDGDENVRIKKAGHVISSMPMTRLVSLFDPRPPQEVLEAAARLSYRSFLIVVLIVDKKDLFPDQWIYIHSPRVRVGRIQNFKNWSAAMIPDSEKTSLGMEYFCTEGDAIWKTPDDELIDMAAVELSQLNLAGNAEVIDGFVVRQPKAYPMYDEHYRQNLQILKDYLGNIKNLQTIGRNGMHRYNNMDHSMLTGLLSAENILGAEHNIWEIGGEKEYLEEQKSIRIRKLTIEKVLSRSFSRIDTLAFASALGSVSGIVVFLATIWLVVKGGEIVEYMDLLNQYFFGYTVSFHGAFISFGYCFLWGFLFGWLFAYLRNLVLAFIIYKVKKKTKLMLLRDFFDNI